MDEDIECSDCGEYVRLTYLNTTASQFSGKGTDHYKCNECGEEFTHLVTHRQ